MTAPGLLVSVRSVAEARSAVAGGASVVDVKEPDRGPLGMADPALWSAVRRAVPDHIPVSVALGELREWADRPAPSPSAFESLAFRKLGLAGSGRAWADDWASLRDRMGPGPPWIAVVYADWREAEAPEPDSVIAEAQRAGCAGVLIDTWSKRPGSPIVDASWRGRVDRIRANVGIAAVAGGLSSEGIARLRSLAPDLFAVRGSACLGGDRRGAVHATLVADLVRSIRSPRCSAG